MKLMQSKHSKLALLAGIIGIHLLMIPPTLAQSVSTENGVRAWKSGDYERAVNIWRQAAVLGDSDAEFNLGQAYKLGRGVEQNMNEALRWYKSAADKGNIRAEDNYGLVLFQQNRRSEAVPFLKKSAARGEPRSQYILGTGYFNGDFVEKDWVRAYALMTASTDSGLPQASKNLALMDRYISASERSAGTKLARTLEQSAMSAQLNIIDNQNRTDEANRQTYANAAGAVGTTGKSALVQSASRHKAAASVPAQTTFTPPSNNDISNNYYTNRATSPSLDSTGNHNAYGTRYETSANGNNGVINASPAVGTSKPYPNHSSSTSRAVGTAYSTDTQSSSAEFASVNQPEISSAYASNGSYNAHNNAHNNAPPSVESPPPVNAAQVAWSTSVNDDGWGHAQTSSDPDSGYVPNNENWQSPFQDPSQSGDWASVASSSPTNLHKDDWGSNEANSVPYPVSNGQSNNYQHMYEQNRGAPIAANDYNQYYNQNGAASSSRLASASTTAGSSANIADTEVGSGYPSPWQNTAPPLYQAPYKTQTNQAALIANDPQTAYSNDAQFDNAHTSGPSTRSNNITNFDELGSAWRVQVGAFSKDNNARKLWRKLSDQHAMLKQWTPYLINKGYLVKLQFGPFNNEGAARKACNQLKNKGQNCFIKFR